MTPAACTTPEALSDSVPGSTQGMGHSGSALHCKQALHGFARIFGLLDELGDISCFAGIADLQLHVPRQASTWKTPPHVCSGPAQAEIAKARIISYPKDL